MEMYLDNCGNCRHVSTVLNYFFFFFYKIWYLKKSSNEDLFIIFILEDPPILPNYESLLVVTERQYNKFYLQIERRLLDGANGPVTHVGVLVTKNPTGGFLFLFLMSVCIAIMVKVFLIILCICFMWLTLSGNSTKEAIWNRSWGKLMISGGQRRLKCISQQSKTSALKHAVEGMLLTS